DLPIVAAARDRDDLGDRLRFLLAKADEDRGARYLRDTLLPSLAYAARPAEGASATSWGRSGPGTPSGWPTGWPPWRPSASRSRPGCGRCWPPGTSPSTVRARS